MKEITEEEARLKIAEICGYEFRDESAKYSYLPEWQQFKAVYHPSGGFVGLCKPDWPKVPDYLNDLNCIHEAEKAFRVGRGKEFNGMDGTLWESYVRGLDPCASARERAKGILWGYGYKLKETK